MKTLFTNARIVNEGSVTCGSMLIEDDTIIDINPTNTEADRVIDLDNAYLMPGVIDDHVHMREPGLTQKATMATETRAAAAGGVTSVMDMPNVVPQTTSIEAWNAKRALGAQECRVNYAFFFGATNDNADVLPTLPTGHLPGIKVFMGSSTGGMLVDDAAALRRVFANSPRLVMTHCEDTAIINSNAGRYGDSRDISVHPLIRSREACIESSRLAAGIARETGAQLHIAHVTTAEELELAGGKVTLEACVPHLLFCDEDYARLGTRIKCNPAIKTRADRDALRKALADGRVTLVATDHAPHLPKDKEGGCLTAASGMPMMQFSLISMLQLLPPEQVARLMCHAPASLFGIERRGFLRPGYKADLAIARPVSPWTLTHSDVVSKCGWSPLEGSTQTWRVEQTWVNGKPVFRNGMIDDNVRGEELCFK